MRAAGPVTVPRPLGEEFVDVGGGEAPVDPGVEPIEVAACADALVCFLGDIDSASGEESEDGSSLSPGLEALGPGAAVLRGVRHHEFLRGGLAFGPRQQVQRESNALRSLFPVDRVEAGAQGFEHVHVPTAVRGGGQHVQGRMTLHLSGTGAGRDPGRPHHQGAQDETGAAEVDRLGVPVRDGPLRTDGQQDDRALVP
ncbi:hypothetical protein KGD83_11380 [Nocardiopsis akebiae]|uniref:Uncharacterized protein n=1 Tax=Nocardiopsis akebiae TaxID=2831968 RepID=A0ABX8C9E0_9ACTN|nr:hypothetical protein KGD83_11380 [Nocardiopsis akebiae]